MWTLLLSFLEATEFLLMANVKSLRFVITHTPAFIFVALGKIKALIYIRAIGEKVPAYKKFLKQNAISLNSIKKLSDLKKLPITTKDNYILPYPLEQRVLYGKLPTAGNIDESAGSTGKATMWVRSFKEEKKLNKLITFALDYTFNSFSKKNVVILNCWSNGPWATGIKFAFIAQHSTLVKAIGTNKENVIDTIKTLGTSYEYVICGYPPFTKEVIDYGESVGVQWSDYRVNIVTGGEGFSEGWRDFMREKIKGSQGEVYSAYGASDIDIGVAFETDFTIAVRKKLTEDQELRKSVLGDERIPLFVGQYNPLIYYIEKSNEGDLLYTLISQHTTSPKIRYNLKDSGSLLTYTQAAALLTPAEKRKYLRGKAMQLPFVIVYGRNDGTVSLDGANIYPADVQHILYSSAMGKHINSFFLETSYDETKSMFFAVHLELAEHVKSNDVTAKEMSETELLIAEYLSRVNKDYKESYENNKASLSPRLVLHEHNDELFAQNRKRIKHVYYAKPRTNSV